MPDPGDLLISAAQVAQLREIVARALDRERTDEDRAGARWQLVGAMEYLLRQAPGRQR